VFSAGVAEASASREARSRDGVLDADLLMDMAALAPDAGFVRTLTSRFAEDARRLIDRIDSALARADHRELRELAHALKGAAAMAGAVGLREAAARLENMTAPELGSLGAAAVRELRGALDATHRALSRMVA
jgi:HPt (histidine-containing phosphotransfer) domain-containing protein